MSVNQPKFVPPGNIRVKPAALVGLKPDGSFAYVAIDANGNVKMAGGGGGGLLTKVVDIGPHSNNGPGDQTKGILDWSANRIRIFPSIGLSKFYNIAFLSYQYAPGSSPTAYLDPHGQLIGLLDDFGNVVLSEYDVQRPFLSPLLGTSLTIQTWPFLMQTATNQKLTASIGAADENLGLFFGDTLGVGELTTGDGKVRVKVNYTIDDILI